jgi:hypothetical protein
MLINSVGQRGGRGGRSRRPSQDIQQVVKEEEDSDDYSDTNTEESMISEEEVKECSNMNAMTLDPYEIDEDDIFKAYVLGGGNYFKNGQCASRSEIKQRILSDDTMYPSVISCIWKGGNAMGVGGSPIAKFVVKLSGVEQFITLGSMDRILNTHSKVKKWYLLPIFGGKRRRVGYEFGVGANHGQIPGFYIYKAFTKEEIKSLVKIEETPDDFPLYIQNIFLKKIHKLDITTIIEGVRKHLLKDFKSIM